MLPIVARSYRFVVLVLVGCTSGTPEGPPPPPSAAPCNVDETTAAPSPITHRPAPPPEPDADAGVDCEFTTATIRLERTACLGHCPVYTVTARSIDGLITFEGQSNVGTPAATGRTGPANVRALACRMKKSGFFSLPTKYRRCVTDVPHVVTTLTIDGKSREVEHPVGGCKVGDAPAWLSEVEHQIDALTGTSKWILGGSRGRASRGGV
jgi:hypothetical protein